MKITDLIRLMRVICSCKHYSMLMDVHPFLFPMVTKIKCDVGKYKLFSDPIVACYRNSVGYSRDFTDIKWGKKVNIKKLEFYKPD